MTRGFGRFLRQNTIALLALFLALGGTTYAASTALIGKNSVASPQVVNGSLQAKDLSKKARKALKGNRGLPGTKGDTGAKGATGSQGVQGPIGPSDAYVAGNGASAGSTTPVTKAVPAGDYVVTAKVVNYGAGAGTNTRCDLTGGSGSDIAFGHIQASGGVSQETLTATTVTHFAAAGTLSWSCTPGTVTHGYAVITATKVGATH
jgi:hypothetical protein